MTPQYPLISICNQAVDIIPDRTYLTKASVWVLLKGKANSLAFDCNGGKWTYQLVSTEVKDNFLTRVLAMTFYNPLVDVQPKWTNAGSYGLPELKAVLDDCIDKDDDLLTQFVEPDTFKQAINDSLSFDEIYATLNRFVFDVDENELLKEKKE